MFRRWRNRARFLPSLGREEKWLIDMNQSTKTVVHTTDRTYVCRKQGLATADIIDFQPVKHPASYAGNRLVGRAIIRRDWGTGTSIYPAHPSAQATLSFAMISREKQSLDRKKCENDRLSPKEQHAIATSVKYCCCGRYCCGTWYQVRVSCYTRGRTGDRPEVLPCLRYFRKCIACIGT